MQHVAVRIPLARVRVDRVRTPGCLTHFIFHHTMKSNLLYAISKRTPPSPNAWREIDSIQRELNEHLTWAHDRLTLARDSATPRGSFAFPLIHMVTPARTTLAPNFRERADDALPRIPDACASGSTRVRDNLWNAHLVAAFLKAVSARHPELLIELRDDGGFVLPGAVWIKEGKVELQRDWLNRNRERALESSGDIEAAVPFLWAEREALEGRFFADQAASEYAEVPEIQELDMDWSELANVGLETVASRIVGRLAAAALAPVAA